MVEELDKAMKRIQAFMKVIDEEAQSNPDLARRISQVLSDSQSESKKGKKKSRRNRRDPPSIDPFALYEKGEENLRKSLAELDLDQLKDLVAGHRMPQSSLALKWKKPERLVELIVETIKTRSHKGDVFRT